MAKRRRDPDKEAYWRRHVAGQAESGLSIRNYCQRQGLAEPSFYLWRRELTLRDREATAEHSADLFLPVTVLTDDPLPGESGNSFSTADPVCAEQSHRLEILTGAGLVIRLRENVPRDVLQSVLVAASLLETACGHDSAQAAEGGSRC